jgi:predicted metal-dependent hydrolase
MCQEPKSARNLYLRFVPKQGARSKCRGTKYKPGKFQVPRPRLVALEFDKAQVGEWHELGPHVTHLYNTLSLMLPPGETFLVAVVRDYLKDVGEPLLREQMLGFIGQEAIHSRIHRQCNDRLESAGLPANAIHRICTSVLSLRRRFTPRITQLAVAVALEHLTAALGGFVLSKSARIKADGNAFTQMWTWHALEEVEHKGVLVDLWNAVVRPGISTYLLRVSTMFFVALSFWATVLVFHAWLIAADPKSTGHLRGLKTVIGYLFGSGGVFRSIARESMCYFSTAFHPWNNDNGSLLQHLERLEVNRIANPIASRQTRHGAP